MNKVTSIVITCPDALSVVLFCTQIIKEFKKIPGARVLVVCKADIFRSELESLGVEVFRVDFYRHLSLSHDLAYIAKLWVLLRKLRADIVFNVSTKPVVYGTVAAKLAGVKWVINYNVGLGKGFLPSPGLRQAFVRGTLRALYWLTYALSNKDWFTNKTDLELLTKARLVHIEKAFVTNFYLDTDHYSGAAVSVSATRALRGELGLPDDATVVSMVARLIWPKGIREFVEAAEILGEGRNVAFVLLAPEETGSDEAVPASYLRSACERITSFRWVNFMADPRPLYALSDVSVLPSFYPEGGFPRALTEPMSMGKPIVTTDNPSCCGTVEDGKNGYIVPMRDSRALAEAILKLLSDQSLREQFGRYSREKAIRDFSEKTIVPQAFNHLGLEPFGWESSSQA